MENEIQNGNSNGAISAESTNDIVVETGPEIKDEVVDTNLPSETEELIGGKFKNNEELLKAYQELEKMKGGDEKSTTEEVTIETEKKEVETETVVPENVIEEFTEKFNENHTVTEEMYKELNDKGYSKDFIDTYVEGIVAKEQKAFEQLIEPLGGPEAYTKAVEWVTNNWSNEQITAYNNALNTANEDQALLIMGNIINLSNQNTSNHNGPIHSNNQVSVESNSYESKSDYTKDANDSRYEKDAVYREKVDNKLLNTDTNTWYR